MRSKVHIKGHPIHPILVSFPIAFFTGAFISDIIFFVTEWAFFSQMARYLGIGGIIFSVMAAIPGLIDYYTIVPPGSSAMKRATKHGILNICVLFIFITAVLIKRDQGTNMYLILFLETAGVATLTVAGWLGGTLVHRNQIGVDHRYAGAGKWKEETMRTENQNKIELKDLDTLGIDQMKLLHIGQKRIVIGQTESGPVAFDDFCTHRGACLADGVMICGVVQCPWHGSQFNVKTGEIKAGPARKPIKTYRIEIIDQKYFLQL